MAKTNKVQEVVKEINKNVADLFTAVTAEDNKTGRGALPGSTSLSEISQGLVTDLMERIKDEFDSETIKDLISDNAKLDAFILANVDIESYKDIVLSKVPSDSVKLVLRSKQSARSHLKAKRELDGRMSLDKFTKMLEAAIAEHLLRESYKIGKNQRGSFTLSGVIEYSDDQIKMFERRQESLAKEITRLKRLKTSAEKKYDEVERETMLEYKTLVESLDMLIGLQKDSYKSAEDTKIELQDMLTSVDTNTISENELKELLTKMREKLE